MRSRTLHPRRRHGHRRGVRASALLMAAGIGSLVLPAGAGDAGRDAGRRAPLIQAPSRASAVTTEGRNPSLSGDGRWIVFEGRAPDSDRVTVYRTDRTTGETIELSHVPAGLRPGDTISPAISTDGCVVVAHTQLALDLFRDDDTDERWDVYRLVVPECGGQFDVWELVSAAGSAGTARDDVVIADPPTVSGSGAVVAFTNPAPGGPDGVTTITVVDLTVPITDPLRSQPVAGVPVEAPNTIYRYRGAGQPALSANGRHLAFRSDTTADDPLPGWGPGPVPGGFATSQVYVWDRGDHDRFTAVQLVSGRDGVPSAAGAEDPAISEDGRIVAFTSIDRGLVDAVYAPCVGPCPSQVFRYDRDTDANGVFDETPRQPSLTLVSAVDAGVVDAGRPVAGNLASWSPAVNTDGSQVAFVTDATNLLPTKTSGGGTTSDGDILVAEILLGSVRRATGNPATGTVPGAHDNPVLSDTGRVIVFDSVVASRVAGDLTLAGRHVVTVTTQPAVSMAAVDFGTVLVGWDSEELYVSLINDGPGAFLPSVVSSTSPKFRVTGGTCRHGVVVPAGGSCVVYLVFNPTEPIEFRGALTVAEAAGDEPISVTSPIRGVGGEPTLQVNPPGVDLDAGVVNGIGGRKTVDVRNVSFLPTSIASIRIEGNHPDDFAVIGQSCTNRALNPDATCSVEIEFQPKSAGRRSALVVLRTPTGQYASGILSAQAVYEPKVDVVSRSVEVGAKLGIGGSGFPANSGVVLRFADGLRPFAIATTNESGIFLIEIGIPTTERAGDRLLIASTADEVAASIEVEIVRRTTPTARLPGYGLG